jgi:DNA-binding ferritin-like protein (Dps family)
MNFYDKITGNDMTKQQKEFQLRIEKLPTDYQHAWQAINQSIWTFSDFSGRNLYPILEGILGLFEESVAENLPITAVTGENIEDFISEIARVAGAKDYRDKLRAQLNQTIAKKLK